MNPTEKIEWNKEFDEIAREFGVRVDYTRGIEWKQRDMTTATAELLIAVLIELRKLNKAKGEKK